MTADRAHGTPCASRALDAQRLLAAPARTYFSADFDTDFVLTSTATSATTCVCAFDLKPRVCLASIARRLKRAFNPERSIPRSATITFARQA